MRRQALVQAPRLKDYDGDIYENVHDNVHGKGRYTLGRQIESEYSFEGNWWYIWFKGECPLDIGDVVVTDTAYTVAEIQIYKNYKRGSVLLEN
ncbi:MAG: hypothetical protein CME58_12660 [Halieaceae bacterium]|nr:hypothetical protein [Halieaceae bacterium]|tara:strand:+ start:486 stop:764 length:279 start_codon:yes stop_codon:yes gene_type:complete